MFTEQEGGDAQRVRVIVDKYFELHEEGTVRDKLRVEDRVKASTPEDVKRVTQQVKDESANAKASVLDTLKGNEKKYLDYIDAAKNYIVAKRQHDVDVRNPKPPLLQSSNPMGDVLKDVANMMKAPDKPYPERYSPKLQKMEAAKEAARVQLVGGIAFNRKFADLLSGQKKEVMSDITQSAENEAYQLANKSSPRSPEPILDNVMKDALEQFHQGNRDNLPSGRVPYRPREPGRNGPELP